MRGGSVFFKASTINYYNNYIFLASVFFCFIFLGTTSSSCSPAPRAICCALCVSDQAVSLMSDHVSLCVESAKLGTFLWRCATLYYIAIACLLGTLLLKTFAKQTLLEMGDSRLKDLTKNLSNRPYQVRCHKLRVLHHNKVTTILRYCQF